jgi:hypothetical protein
MGVDLDEPLILEILAEADRVLADYVSAEGRMEFEPKHLGSAVIANAECRP